MSRQQPIELFMPPNMLKAKVGGTFVGLDMAAVNRAEAAMEELKSEFANWAQDDVRRLVAARDAFAAKPDSAARAGLLMIAPGVFHVMDMEAGQPRLQHLELQRVIDEAHVGLDLRVAGVMPVTYRW